MAGKSHNRNTDSFWKARLPRFVRRSTKTVITLAILAAFGLLAYGFASNRPQDVPWGSIDLRQPVGAFTGRKLTALADDPDQCRFLLGDAGIAFEALPSRGSNQCITVNPVRPLNSGALSVSLSPSDVAPSCPVVAALALWEWHVLRPAAREYLGSDVVRIRHFGSYSCRRMYGNDSGAWSEHATANAIDIAAFDLANGQRISVLGDWKGDDKEAQFLREIRDGACDLFATVLSPDYNAAHADHFHFDQANRGAMGWRACR